MYLSALAIGLSCSVGCGSVSTPFLTAYVIGKSKNLKSSVLATIIFSLGKIIIMAVLGGLTAFISASILPDNGILFGINLTIIFNIITFIIGFIIILTAFKKRSYKNCCSGCKNYDIISSEVFSIKEAISLFFAGAAYGITPCVPFITVLVMAIPLGLWEGVALLSFFGLVTCIAPALIQIFVAGLVTPKIKKDLKKSYKYISLIAGIVLIVISSISIVGFIS